MTEGESLLAAVCHPANLRDRLTRKVYADWLDANAGTVPCPKCGGGKWAQAYNYQTGKYTECPVCRDAFAVPGPLAVLAEFIRAQCDRDELVDMNAPAPCPENAKIYELNKTIRYLLRNHWEDFCPEIVPNRPHTFSVSGEFVTVLTGDRAHITAGFGGGFVQSVTGRFAPVVGVLSQLVKRHPLHWVGFSDKSPRRTAGGYDWLFGGVLQSAWAHVRGHELHSIPAYLWLDERISFPSSGRDSRETRVFATAGRAAEVLSAVALDYARGNRLPRKKS